MIARIEDLGFDSQSHAVHAQAPADSHDQGKDEQADLHAGAERDADGKIHPVFPCHQHRGCVLGPIAHNGEQDETDKRRWWRVGAPMPPL